MAQQALEALLREDPFGALITKVSWAIKKKEGRCKKRFPCYDSVEQLVQSAMAEPSVRSELRGLDWNSNEQVGKAAELVGTSSWDLVRFHEEQAAVQRAYRNAAQFPNLKRSWKLLLRNAPIQEIDSATFPGHSAAPFLVLYTAEWCGPCWMVKPTFARLSRFLPEAWKIFYTTDEDLARQECPEVFWPQLVAYRVSGAKVTSDCGETTQELWDNMHHIFLLAPRFSGVGTLACTEKECRIEQLQS